MSQIHQMPAPPLHRSWLAVDLAAIAQNVRTFRTLVGKDVLIMPVVKDDAYGHGAIAVGVTVLEAGASRLAVAISAEGEELRAAGITAPIQILGSSLPLELARAIQSGLIISVHDFAIPRLASEEAVRQNREVVLHLKIDTGMGRLGIAPEEVVKISKKILALPKVKLEGLFMHFSDAADDAYSDQQLTLFQEAIRRLKAVKIDLPIHHACGSTSTILRPEARGNLIRPGAGIYGFHNPAHLADKIRLRPALTWHCVIAQIRDFPANTSIGYGRTFTTSRPTRAAVLPLGYADGYNRAFSNRAEVLISGRRAAVIGMISMDYTLVDVTDFPDEVEIGSEVTIIGASGEDRITVEELASRADTVPHCIVSHLGRRPSRAYIQSTNENSSERQT